MSECRTLQRKNQRVKSDLLVVKNTAGSVDDVMIEQGSSEAEDGLSLYALKALVGLKGGTN